MPRKVTDQDLSDLVREVEDPKGTVGAAIAWRNEPTKWVVEKLPIVGELPNDFRAIASAAARDLYENRGWATYSAQGGLRDNEYAELANARAAAGKTATVGGDIFPKLDAWSSATPYGVKKRKTAPNLYAIAITG